MSDKEILKEKAKAILSHPEALGWALGYKDFTPEHETYIRENWDQVK